MKMQSFINTLSHPTFLLPSPHPQRCITSVHTTSAHTTARGFFPCPPRSPFASPFRSTSLKSFPTFVSSVLSTATSNSSGNLLFVIFPFISSFRFFFVRIYKILILFYFIFLLTYLKKFYFL